MTAAIFVGAFLGVGLILVGTGLRPAPLPLDRALAELHRRHRDPLGLAESRPTSAITRLFGSTWTSSATGLRLTASVSSDLRLTGMSAAEYLAQRVVFALVGLLWAPVASALMLVGGVEVGLTFPLWVSIALAPVGFMYPAVLLRSRAADRRRTFRHALSSFLDVVSVSLAGGRGVDSALNDGANAGHGWAFDELQRALLEAQLLGDTPWMALARLGEELAVPELGELAASASLAGTEGARVRSSLAAKARAIRVRGLADIEAAAQSATERMTLPIVLLMVGFVVFLAYPAVDKVLNGI